MNKILLSATLILISTLAFSQGFEMMPVQQDYKATIGETVRVPLRFKNTSAKTITLIIRKVNEQLGSTQKKYFCIDTNCLDSKVEDYSLRVEAGQSVTNFYVTFEAGLDQAEGSIRYVAYNKSLPSQSVEIDLTFNIDEKPNNPTIYTSRHITLFDVYPNPAIEVANLSYRLTTDHVKAKILLHNIIGNVIGEYNLSAIESAVRIKTEDLSAGIYFYTLYVENEGVMTRKLIVKK